jgi:hypothetical protein
MKSAYLVTENNEAADWFKQVLPPDLLKDTEVVSAKGRWYAAFSLAGTIMSVRSRPVILIIDADSESLAVAQEKVETTTSLLLPAASAAPYKVCVAVPSIATLDRQFGDDRSPDRIQEIQQHPLVQQVIEFLAGVFSSVL